ncbi:MAG TPA: ArsR family transcriptional regulator [Candidatus Thermoplasmatota archaeon]|nr:ArsR family transcriptional regulator [Candidatus Thermoplasmatota archaeon]
MRTYLLVVVSLLVLTSSAGLVAAEEPLPIDQLLDQLLRQQNTADPLQEGSQDQGQEGSDASGKPRGTIATVLLAASFPVRLVGDTLAILGLNLVAGLYAGMSEGAKAMGAAATAVVANPIDSTLIATLTVAAGGFFSTLAYLAQKYGGLGSIPLYTRIAKSDLLENNIRQQIFDLISQNPGVNVSEIARRLDIAWGTATHHLHKLRHERLVSIRIASNQKCYFPNGGTYTQKEMDVMSAVKHPTARQIADFLVRMGPQCHGDIAQLLDLTPALVSFHADKLVHAGVVARHRDGRRTIFTPLEANLAPQPRPASH